MKKILLFGTKPAMFLSLLAPIFLLVVSIINNPAVETPGKLYPLMVAAGIAIIFIIAYLVRGIRISTEEVRSIGLFSSRDRVELKEGKTLSLLLRPKRKIKVEVNGVDDTPGLDWLKDSEEGKGEINLYRDSTVGGVGSIRKLLRLLELDNEQIEAIVSSDEHSGDYGDFTVCKTVSEIGTRYDIKFLKTI